MGILLAVTGGFALGLFAHGVWAAGWAVGAFVLLLAALMGGAAFLYERRVAALCALACVCVALGVGRAMLAEAPLPAAFLADLRQRVSYEGVVVGDPDVRESSVRIPVRVAKGGTRTTALAVVSLGTKVGVGDRVHVTGTLLKPEPFEAGGGRTFRYDKYLEVRGVRFMLSYGSVRVTQAAPWYSASAALARIKHWFLRGLGAALPAPESALAGGVVIGGKTGLGSELQELFVRTGLVQIIVLSGYNVMVVAEWAMLALGAVTKRRAVAAAAGALALLLFVGIAGFSATAVRAALMALIALYARATGKSYAASRALLVVVLCMLAWNPLLLVYDPGFELSVAATAGLIWLAPLVGAKLAFIKNAFWQEAAATTLAAQLAVAPLLLYETGNLSIVSIPANLLVAPMVPLAMGLSAAAGVIGALLNAFVPTLVFVLSLPAYLANWYLVEVARLLGGLSWAAYTIPAFPFVFVCAAYAALAAVAWVKRPSTTPQLRLAKKASKYFDLSPGR